MVTSERLARHMELMCERLAAIRAYDDTHYHADCKAQATISNRFGAAHLVNNNLPAALCGLESAFWFPPKDNAPLCTECRTVAYEGGELTTTTAKLAVPADDDMDENTLKQHLDKRHRAHGRIVFFRLVDGIARHRLNHRFYPAEQDHYHKDSAT